MLKKLEIIRNRIKQQAPYLRQLVQVVAVTADAAQQDSARGLPQSARVHQQFPIQSARGGSMTARSVSVACGSEAKTIAKLMSQVDVCMTDYKDFVVDHVSHGKLSGMI